MTRATLALLVVSLAWAASCGGRALRFDGPAPEYERPEVPPWDAGAPRDPLAAAAEGEWLDETSSGDAGAAEAPEGATFDAGAPPSEGGRDPGPSIGDAAAD